MPPTPPVRLESDFQIYGEGNVRPHRLGTLLGHPAEPDAFPFAVARDELNRPPPVCFP